MMTKTQKHLLKLFSEIDKICKENDIDYYIAGGSTIGAVRHEGFIPWDDDFDIMMTRKNFLKFVDYCKDNLPEDRILECQELNRNYHNMFARYTDKTMTTLHHPQLYHDDNAGFVIDILPLDPLPNGDEAYQEYLKNLMLYSDLLNSCTIYSFRYNFNAKEYIKNKIKILFLGRDKVLRRIEQKLFCHDEDTATHFAMRWGGIPLLFEKKMYDGKRYVDFFGMKGQVPYRMSDYLVQHYGDTWFMLPPNQEQQTHDAIFSTVIKQDDVRKVLGKRCHVKWYKFLLTLRKFIYFTLMDTQKVIKMNRRFLKAKAYEFDINNDLNNKKQLILSLDKEKNYNKLQEIFSEYFSMQLSRAYSGREDYLGVTAFYNPILFKIDDNLFEIAIKTLINKNGMASALRLMDIYEQHGFTLSKNLKYYKELLLFYRSLVSRADLGEDISDKNRIKEVIETFPCAEMFINFALELYQNDYDNYNKILNYAKQHAPQEDLVVKAQLDQKPLDFDTIYSYIKLYTSSFNGILRLSIKKIFENKQDEILAILNATTDVKKATYLSYEAAVITPETKVYIEFYLNNCQKAFSTVDEQIGLYISLKNYYTQIVETEELLKHFTKETVDAFSKVFKNEYLATCLPFLINKENLDQTQDRREKIEEILLNTSNASLKAWCNLFLIENYKKLGLLNKTYDLYKKLIKHVGSSALFDSLFAICIKADVTQILKTYKKLESDTFLTRKQQNAYGKKLKAKNIPSVREEYYQSILNAVKFCFDSPNEAFKVLTCIGILNEKKFNLDLAIKFKKSEYSSALDSWSIDVLTSLCKSVELQKTSFENATDEDEMKIVHQDDTNENEQFDDIHSRAVTLLSEIDKICQDNDIKYGLYNTSINALMESKLPTAKIKVIMSVQDFDKFVTLMQKCDRPDRSFECLKTNPLYQSFSAKYFDLNSTRINLLDPYSKIDAGICVEILPVCPLVSDKSLQKRLLETEVLTYTFKDIITSPRYLLAYLSGKAKSLFANKQKRANRLYCDLIDKYSLAKSKKYFVKEYGLSALVMNENPLKELLSFEVDGVYVTVPQKINYYLKAIKRLPKTNVYKNENKAINRVVSQNCKREEFISLYKKEIDDFACAAKKQLNLQRIITILNRKRRKNWTKANVVAHKYIHEQELKLAEKDCTIKYQDYLKNLENSGAKALYFTKHL